ncbi:helix-turn-helix transcriptional regulator [Eggerthellaceae bacterium 24-137]
MSKSKTIGMRPEHIRYALGYGSANAWGVMMLYAPLLGSLDPSLRASLSMLPGLAVCLCCLFLFRQRLACAGRTPLVAAASLCASLGTLCCTYPSLVVLPGAFVGGMVLSGLSVIILIMAWFDTFAHIGPRGIIVLSGCSIAVAALECWVLIQCDEALTSVLVSLLPMLSFVLLPLGPHGKQRQREAERRAAGMPSAGTEAAKAASAEAEAAGRGRLEVAGCGRPEVVPPRIPGLRDVLLAAVPLRTLAGFAITFFVLSSITTIVVGRAEPTQLGVPTLVIPLAAALFFVASGFFARGKIDPSILYKVLLCATAAFVFFSFYVGRGNGALTLYAHNIIEAMAWVVLALGAKKTPVAPYLVFAVGWIAECVGKTLGQLTVPLLASDPLVLMAVVAMLVLLGVGFAFSEGYHLLDIDEDGGEVAAPRRPASCDGVPSEGSGDSRLSGDDEVRGRAGVSYAEGGSAHPPAARRTEGAASVNSCDSVGDGAPTEEASDLGAPTAIGKPDLYAAFCAEYDLSPRESEVFRLWVTGHGLKYIQNALFVSESTVKSHLRSIYRKCDTHNRDEIIALFEREVPTLV